MARTDKPWRLTTAGTRILLVAAAYYAAGLLGGLARLVAVGGLAITPLWPASGIALFSLIALGPEIWPGITLGSFLFNVSTAPFHPSAIGIAVGNTLAPVCAYLLLRRVGFRPELDRLKDGLALVFFALAGTLISATLAIGSLAASRLLPESSLLSIWSFWTTGDAMGVLLVTPVLLLLRQARLPREASALRWLEAITLLAGTAALTLTITRTTLHLLFLVFPLLIWGALRFQLAGAAPCALLISVLTTPAAVHRTGPFAGHGLPAIMFVLQLFNGTTALTALLLATVITERNNTHHKLQDVCKTLTEVVARLSPGMGPR